MYIINLFIVGKLSYYLNLLTIQQHTHSGVPKGKYLQKLLIK